MTNTILIPVSRIKAFEKVANKLVRKAAKLGVVFDHKFGPKETIVKQLRKDGKLVTVALEYVPVHTTGEEQIKLGDWTPIAKIEFTEGGAMVFAREHELHAEYGKATSKCEHCKHNRARKEVYILEDISGKRMQVGSTCLREFTGLPSALELAKLYTSIVELSEGSELGEDEAWACFGPRVFNTEGYLAQVWDQIDRNGWISGTAAYQRGIESTATVASNYYINDVKIAEPDKAFAEVELALEWARNITPTNDYEHNMHVVANCDVLNDKQRGIAASILEAYRKAMEVTTEPSEHVGTVGKRETFTAKLCKISWFETQYGWSGRHEFKDADGNIMIWFTSSDSVEDFKGMTLTFKATVKKHDEFNGTNQTILNRVALEK